MVIVIVLIGVAIVVWLAEWIRKQIGNKVEESQLPPAQSTLDRVLQSEVVVEMPSPGVGTLYSSDEGTITTTNKTKQVSKNTERKLVQKAPTIKAPRKPSQTK